tara:strand:- start:515 stop:721 length:207 start_codon:yes stop_codon:yes gene_type:complete
MTIQQIIDELKNIKEQASNDDEITKNSIVEAITDLIHDAEGSEFDFSINDDEMWNDSFNETDFTQLEI